MNAGTVRLAFRTAEQGVKLAVSQLTVLRGLYEASDLPDRKARVRALDAKIDALQAMRLDPTHVPWCDDFATVTP